jgi:hypothetical protein
MRVCTPLTEGAIPGNEGVYVTECRCYSTPLNEGALSVARVYTPLYEGATSVISLHVIE